MGVSFERSGENDFDQIRTSGVPGGSNNQNGRFVFTDTRAGSTSTGLAIGNAAMGLFNTYAEIGQRAYTPYRGDDVRMVRSGFVESQPESFVSNSACATR